MNRKQLLVVWGLAAWLLSSLVWATRWECPYWNTYQAWMKESVPIAACEQDVLSKRSQKLRVVSSEPLPVPSKRSQKLKVGDPIPDGAQIGPIAMPDDDLQTKIARAKAAGYSDAEIQEYLSKAGTKVLVYKAKLYRVPADATLEELAQAVDGQQPRTASLEELEAALDPYGERECAIRILFGSTPPKVLPEGLLDELHKRTTNSSAAILHMRERGEHRYHWFEWHASQTEGERASLQLGHPAETTLGRLRIPSLAGLLIAAPLFLTFSRKHP